MADLKQQFSDLTRMKYSEQAKWFLNGFWSDGIEKEAENVWKCTQKFIELDKDRKVDGNELDEFLAHKFLESLGETLTVIALRDKLRKIDLDCNGKMALLEYLAFRYGKGVKDIVDAPQGENPEELKKATQKLQAVQDALTELKKTQAELKIAVDELNSQETAYNNEVKALETKSKDASASMVARNKAAAELAQLKEKDPLPLRKAKTTQEAALRKVEKQTKETEARMREAEEYLNQVRKQGGSPLGACWYLDRELLEAKKYLPQKKQ